MMMSRKRLVYLTVSLFLVLATVASTSQSVEVEGCIGWWCRLRRPCFAAADVEHCNPRGCSYTCLLNSYNQGVYCKRQDNNPTCCCNL
ncbi:unnamed protein product [Urochloa decumbens]|uniref:Uncharacterized protein n=1 Tax=Urochloa decumbens TaxID=240449 RepID=A0ABC9AMV0_9POAL